MGNGGKQSIRRRLDKKIKTEAGMRECLPVIGNKLFSVWLVRPAQNNNKAPLLSYREARHFAYVMGAGLSFLRFPGFLGRNRP